MKSQQAQPQRPIQRDGARLKSLQNIREQANAMVAAVLDHADSQTKIQRRIKLANYAVAALVMLFGFLSYTQIGKQIFGDTMPLVIAVLGAVFLLLDAYTPHLLDDPNPDRFRDYAFYIQKYARDIDTHIANSELPEIEWNARGDLLTDWTRTNMDDASLKFTNVRKLLPHHGKSA